jgi:hypothetical protein
LLQYLTFKQCPALALIRQDMQCHRLVDWLSALAVPPLPERLPERASSPSHMHYTRRTSEI